MVIVSITPEIALEDSRTYAGGLGVLEGDKFYAAGDMNLDYLVLSLFYRHGYLEVKLGESGITLEPEEQEEKFYNKLKPEREIVVKLKGTSVYVRPWVYTYKTAKAVLFEAVCPEWARKLTDRVYIEENDEEKYLKYILLAKASAEYLTKRVGLNNVAVIDLEESYSALVLYVLDIDKLSRIIIHTPGPWGHPVFPREVLEKELGAKLEENYVDMTKEAVKRLREVIVVSKKQENIIPLVFPEVRGKTRSVTNGIYLERWMEERLLKAWLQGSISVDVLKEVRKGSKEKLQSLLRKYKPGVEVGGKPVVCWARRLSRYKRPYFIAKFIEEHPDLDAIYVLAGKPHPRDLDGVKYLEWFRTLSMKFKNVVYVPVYDVEVAKVLTRGSDVWLFTPFSGWEACGTSYMKALVNGVPVLSSRDGGVLEVVEDGFNGWLFGLDLREFINIYEDPRALEIDKREYGEFSDKLLNAINLYNDEEEEYWKIALNAWRSAPSRVDIRKTLREYYLN